MKQVTNLLAVLLIALIFPINGTSQTASDSQRLPWIGPNTKVSFELDPADQFATFLKADARLNGNCLLAILQLPRLQIIRVLSQDLDRIKVSATRKILTVGNTSLVRETTDETKFTLQFYLGDEHDESSQITDPITCVIPNFNW